MNAPATGPLPQVRERAADIDALRGLAILLVVLGHCVQYNVADFDASPVFRVIYAFHMPLFMFISGFFAWSPAGARPGALRAKAATLVVPFLFWLPIAYAYLVLTKTPQVEGVALDPSSFALHLLRSPDAGGLWFLWVLFLQFAALLACQRLAPRRTAMAMVALIVLANALVLLVPRSNVLGLGLFRWYAAFFTAGFVAGRNREAFSAHARRWWPGWVLVFACAVSIWQRKPAAMMLALWPGLERHAAEVLGQGFNLAVSCAAIVALFGFFACRTEGVAAERGLARIGRFTLEIYAVHYYPLYLAVAVLSLLKWPEPIRIIAALAFVLVVTPLVIQAMGRWPALARLAFGRPGPSPASREAAR